MRANVVQRELEVRQRDLAVDVERANQIAFLIDPLAPLIETLVEHPAYPQTELSLSVDTLGNGGWLLLRAGQVSTVTLTGLTGWRFDSASLNAETRGPRIAIPASPAPLVYDSPDDSIFHARVRFEPARYVHSVLVVARQFTGISIRPNEQITRTWPDRNGAIQAQVIDVRRKVDEIEDAYLLSTRPPRNWVMVVDNVAMGLAISTAEDRLLHRAPQALTDGQSATTPNMADVLNGAGGDSVTLNLMSQSDCVLFLSGSIARRRAAEGFQTAPEDPLILGPWSGVPLLPNPASSPVSQTTHLRGKLKRSGAARLGLTQEITAGRQILRAHPRLHYVQPFQPLAEAEPQTVTLAGLWLLLDRTPEEDATLSIQIGLWDDRLNAAEEAVTRASATLPAGLSAYEPGGPGGLLPIWIPFDTPWELDPDDQPLLHALTLTDIDGPAGLVETALAHARLLPAMYRDVSRSGSLAKRSFAGVDKALLFDLGRTVDAASLVIEHGGGAVTVPASDAFAAFDVTVPRGPLMLGTTSGIEIEGLTADTATLPIP